MLPRSVCQTARREGGPNFVDLQTPSGCMTLCVQEARTSVRCWNAHQDCALRAKSAPLRLGPADYFSKFELKYFRFEVKSKFLRNTLGFESKESNFPRFQFMLLILQRKRYNVTFPTVTEAV